MGQAGPQDGMDRGLEAGGIAEIAHGNFAEPGKIAPGQGGTIAMLEQPELALLWGGVRAEDFGGNAAWRYFKYHENEGRDGQHSEQHGDQTLAEEQQHCGGPRPSREPDSIEVVVQARMRRR